MDSRFHGNTTELPNCHSCENRNPDDSGFNKKFYLKLKSLKFYLLQYRNIGIFYAHVVNRILDDLVSVLSPQKMEVTGDFTARGGITSRISAIYEENK